MHLPWLCLLIWAELMLFSEKEFLRPTSSSIPEAFLAHVCFATGSFSNPVSLTW